MNGFSIQGETNFITITLDEVHGFPDSISYLGGYEVRASLKIKSGDFQLSSLLWIATGALYELLQQLKECNQSLSGNVTLFSHEHNFELFLAYDKAGHVNVSGRYAEPSDLKNELHFEFISDQTFIASTIKELELIAGTYGGMKGITL